MACRPVWRLHEYRRYTLRSDVSGLQFRADNKGFVLTDAGFSGEDTDRQCLPLETSIPGFFAIGDVRASSTKRVGAAIGEGAAVVAQIHQVLGRMHTRAAENASA
jgi:thioredoxin reductase (NADPH)